MDNPVEALLSIRGLSVDFPETYGEIGLLQKVSLDIGSGECVGLVGESGCGKSLLGLTILGLQSPRALVTGSIRFKGKELVGLPERELRSLRGSELAMIYQDALVSLNPVMKIRRQLQQALLLHQSKYTPVELLEAVRIRDANRCLDSYPFELSGGQRQRILIALALAGNPSMIVADEPTTALDVTVQSQVVRLLAELREDLGFGLLFITHDLGLISTVADRIVCMYAGQCVESGSVNEMLSRPQHPYMNGLLAASRSLEEGHERLAQIPGLVPTPHNFGAGCRFVDRCSRSIGPCSEAPPPALTEKYIAGVRVACHNPIEVISRVSSE